MEDILFGILFFFMDTWPVWTLIVCVSLAWSFWMRYLNRKFIENIKWVLLEVRIPKEVFKSPFAMEMVIANALTQSGGVGTWVQRYWLGNVLNWFSLEIVSTEGNVRFFIRTSKNFKMIIENQLYAQYPQAEITEVDDYVIPVMASMNKEPWSLFGANFILSKEDVFPIKTYVDYNLDQAPEKLDQEQIIDPITPVIEFLGSMRPGEHLWIQIMVRVATKRYLKPGNWFKKGDWKDEGKDVIKRLKEEYGGTEEKPKQMTEIQRQTLSALEKSMLKPGFDTGIRTMYLAKKESFDAFRIGAMLGAFKQYNSGFLNGFKPTNTTGFDYPWQDPTGRRARALKQEMFDAYIRRSYFYEPYKMDPFVLNSEELATIFHLPGAVSETPQLKRIESTKSEPPTNLPL
jgi:hypothetical protein